jgi:hypothetical protein
MALAGLCNALKFAAREAETNGEKVVLGAFRMRFKLYE